MKRKVIVAFDYAEDGVHVNRLKVGRSYEFPVELAERFEREGKLEPIGGTEPVVMPATISGEDFAASAPIVTDEPAVADLRAPSRGGRPKIR